MAYTRYDGSQSVTTTEHSMPNDATYASGSVKTDDGIVQCWIDLNALAAGDEFEVKMYEKIDGTNVRLAGRWSFSGAQDQPAVVLPAVAMADGWDFTIIKIAGTDRTIYWSVRIIPV